MLFLEKGMKDKLALMLVNCNGSSPNFTGSELKYEAKY